VGFVSGNRLVESGRFFASAMLEGFEVAPAGGSTWDASAGGGSAGSGRPLFRLGGGAIDSPVGVGNDVGEGSCSSLVGSTGSSAAMQLGVFGVDQVVFAVDLAK